MKLKAVFVNFLLLYATCVFPNCKPSKSKVEDKLNIKFPQNASQIVILGQSSHLDISWFYSSDEYYEKLVKGIFIKFIDFVKSDPLHTGFFAETFWIRRFLSDETVEKSIKDEFRKFLENQNIKIEGGGVGTDDHLVVPTESIIRNYLRGRAYLKEHRINPTDCAWIPDSFGFLSSTPDLLSILGFKAVGLSRINGFSLQTSNYLRRLTQGDFVENSGGWELFSLGQLVRWKGLRSEIILYWMPNLYGVGSFLFCKLDVPSNVYINPDMECIGDPADEEIFSQKLIEYLRYVKTNSRFVFIPIGWDFEKPKFELGKFIRYWNEKYFPITGVFVVAGSFCDYIDLVQKDKSDLPVFSGHLAPYWTGYFGARAYLKKFLFSSVFSLLSAETTIGIAKLVGVNIYYNTDELWWELSKMSNHDTGAGTLYRRVENIETKPLVEKIEEELKNLWNFIGAKLSKNVPKGKYLVVNTLGFERSGVPPFGFIIKDKVIFDQPVYHPCPNIFKPVLWYDEGGAWRIGSEVPPGRFEEVDFYSYRITHSCHYFVREDNGSEFYFRVEFIPLGHSLTLRFTFPRKISKILVEGHLGIYEFEKRYLIYNPTFLPFLTFFKVVLEDGSSETFSVKGARGVAQTSERTVDIFVGRNVSFEKHDILGPLGDMSEDGPFEIHFVTFSNLDDIDSFKKSYDFHFPLKYIEGSSETGVLLSKFSALSVRNNIGIFFSEDFVRVIIPVENLEFESDVFSSAESISVIHQSRIHFSNTFRLKRR